MTLADVANAAGVEAQLHRHRLLIETAPLAAGAADLARAARMADAVMSDLKLRIAAGDGPRRTALSPAVSTLQIWSARVFETLRHDQRFAEPGDFPGGIARETEPSDSEPAHKGDVGVMLAAYVAAANDLQLDARRQSDRSAAAANEEARRLSRAISDLERIVIGAALGIVLVFAAIGLLIAHMLVGRLQRLTDAVLKLADNDTAVAIPETSAGDEIGAIARAVEVFKGKAIALIHRDARLEELNAWFEIALDNMARGLSMFDDRKRLIVCNKAYRDLYRLPDALTRPGTTFDHIVAHRVRTGTGLIDGGESAFRAAWPIATHKRHQQVLRHDLADGRIIQVAFQGLTSGGWVAVHEDVTDAFRSAETSERMARQDVLTGLSNRRHFHERLHAALLGISPEIGIALHWIDLDGFKSVNDTYGHPIGDKLLCAVAARLTASVRETDFIARLGGDEFAVIQADVKTARHTDIVARRLIANISRPYDIEDHALSIGASIGIVRAPMDGIDADDLLQRADIALYRAKAEGKGRLVHFCRSLAATGERATRSMADAKVDTDRPTDRVGAVPAVDLRQALA
ncbi:MAG: diguanylate cyclase domain-containing protein [Hyphomicrobium sp.]